MKTLVALGALLVLWTSLAMASPHFQATGIAQAGVGPVSVPWPTHQANDIGLLVCATANEVVATPAGWALVSAPQGTGSTGGSASTRLTVFWKRAVSAAEPDTVIAGSFNYIVAQIVTFRGCVQIGDPWDVVGGDVLTQSSQTVSIAGPATSVDGCLLVAVVSNATDSPASQAGGWSNPSLASVLERTDVNTDQGNGGGFALATGEKTFAGTYAPTTATLQTSSAQALMSIALKSDGTGIIVVPPVSMGRANLHTGFLGAFRIEGMQTAPLIIPVSNPHSFRDIAIIRSVCRMHMLQLKTPIYAATLLFVRGSDFSIIAGAALDTSFAKSLVTDHQAPAIFGDLTDRDTDLSPNYIRVRAGEPLFAIYQTYPWPTEKGHLYDPIDLCEIDIIFAYALFRNDAAMDDVLES